MYYNEPYIVKLVKPVRELSAYGTFIYHNGVNTFGIPKAIVEDHPEVQIVVEGKDNPLSNIQDYICYESKEQYDFWKNRK